MNTEKILGLLGLANRAGQISAGAMQTEKAIMTGKCKLLLIAEDVAPETLKRLTIMTEETGTPKLKLLTKLQLGTAVGMSKLKNAIQTSCDSFLTRSLSQELCCPVDTAYSWDNPHFVAYTDSAVRPPVARKGSTGILLPLVLNCCRFVTILQ